jgi:hypothetical protein
VEERKTPLRHRRLLKVHLAFQMLVVRGIRRIDIRAGEP